ncbi:toll/interleukin-1 receptor domain-containing protein [Saccharothrix longispora]|uniref:Tetratricopeptide (TPR) repeat protein n=1 Tax=Saccharothrix longispora TaxID=33920 RepID=A0ABU1PXC1_9PSEU|nr:toll/interleukin-1 receptor domain-containing protein [Saccharothrix longispora]MDR6594539.1 tetratricopeptide (TPR) repeat protein [Saccharothrix longispora]
MFISYAQESEEHRAVVRRLWAFLRRHGIDAVLDQVAAGERQDWALWMSRQIEQADVVLCVASEQYRLRAQGRTGPHVGRGVQWEARLIRDAFHAAQDDLQKFVPVVVPGQTVAGVPDFLAPSTTTVYVVESFTKTGAEKLLRFLLRKPELRDIPLGEEPEFDTWEPETEPEAPSAKPVLDGVVSPQVTGMAEIIGREQDLADLRTAFTAARTSRAPVVQILTGMGGVGKTSLARAYAQRHLDDYAVVWWIRAEDPTAIDGEYRGLLELVHSAQEAKLVRDAVQRANAWLAEQRQPWLLVLDNVPDAALRGLFPARGVGHVLVTSQAKHWPNPNIVHPVEPLDPDAAITLLTEVSEDDDTVAAAELAAELDGLPLALAQAASFTATNGTSLAAYLRFYRERSADLLSDGQPVDYPHTVATTWLLAIGQLTPPARRILDTIAYFAPDSIPLSVLQPLVDDELTFIRAIGNLLSHSLVTRGAEDTITVHRLVQAVTRHRLGEAVNHVVRARGLLAAAMPKRPLNKEATKAWNAIRSHILAVADRVPTDPPTFDLRYDQAFLHGDAGDIRAAIAQLEALVDDMAPVLGREDERVLRARFGVAYWTDIYDTPRARALLEELLEVQSGVLGAEHVDTLDTRHNLAAAYLDLGNHDHAHRMLEDLLPARLRVLGPDHEDTLETRRCLAEVMARSGRFEEAIAAYEEVIADAVAAFGESDLKIVLLRSLYANVLGESGDAAAARDLYAEVLDQSVAQLGPYDKFTLAAYLALAMWTARTGNPQRAAHMLLRVLIRLSNSLGKNNPLVKQFENGLNSIRGGGPPNKSGKRIKKRKR